ncbi:hypothetical protein WJX79_010787 [Trebouxia sp. C0005]
MEGSKVKIGDVVWAKCGNHPWWPAQVTRPDPIQLPALRETYGSAMHTRVHVRFFGDSGQCAVVPAKFIEEFDKNRQMRRVLLDYFSGTLFPIRCWTPSAEKRAQSLSVILLDNKRRSSEPIDSDCWWVQVYEPGKGLAFHFDKDEHAMKEKHQMIQPVLSSVLYLTGDFATERLGPTAVIDQQFDAEQGKAVPDSPARTALIFPCRNNYVLFDGRLGHGVLGSSSKKPRMTMLINWWAEKPQDVNVIPAELPECDAKAEQVEVPAISIAGWDESPVSVDDVLETYGLQLTGPSAVHAVAIDHSGFDLFPLDEENLEANAGSIVTAAAFVPVGLVSDQSDSESQDTTCSEVEQ